MKETKAIPFTVKENRNIYLQNLACNKLPAKPTTALHNKEVQQNISISQGEVNKTKQQLYSIF